MSSKQKSESYAVGPPIIISTADEGVTCEEREHLVAEGLDILIPRIAKLCSRVKQGSILDVGCGFGTISGILQSTLDMKAFGLDCDSDRLQEANKKGIVTAQINLETDKFPFEDETFDTALFVEVLEHIARPQHCLSEISRVIKRNGELILTTPNLTSLKRRSQILRGKDPLEVYVTTDGASHRHIRLYARDSLTKLLSNWFSVTKVEYCTPARAPSWRRYFGDFACLLKEDLNKSIIVKCKKR